MQGMSGSLMSGAGEAQPSRGELLPVGALDSPAAQQAERLGVRSGNLQGAFEATFDRWGRWWICLVVMLFLGMFCVIIWSQWVYDSVKDDQCDQPLKLMLRLLYFVIGIHAFQKEVVRHVLRYIMTRDGPVEPCRVVVFRRSLYLATALWPLVATWMLAEVKKCDSQLKLAVTVLAVYFAVLVAVMVLLPAVFVSAMLWLVRRGLVRLPRSSAAAPDDLIDRLPSPRYDPELFDDSGRPNSYPSACSICLEAFSDSQTAIVRTPCGTMSYHAFHKECLKDWLQCARTCPLCRKDLVEAMDCPEALTDLEAGTELTA